MTDAGVWGPVIVAIALMYVGHGIEREIRESARQRDVQHRETIDLLNTLSVDLEQLAGQLSLIEQNTSRPLPHDY